MFAASATLQKKEGVQVGTSHGFSLLSALAKRSAWIGATILGLLGWGAAAALSLAPIAVVMPVMGSGIGVMVVIGVRWLGERFGPRDLLAILLIGAGGTAAAILASGPVVRRPLSLEALLAVGAAAFVCALIARRRRTAVGFGLAAGLLYGSVAVYTKEIGDRFAVDGMHAVGDLLAGPVPWLLGGSAILALTFLQAGFQRGNAATVSAAMTGPEILGPILAGLLLYHEHHRGGAAGVLLAISATAVVGGIALASRAQAHLLNSGGQLSA
jgi:drug/metabolite transporter (DMT)-like permease